MVAKSNLWAKRNICKRGVVDSFGQTRFTAAPIGAGVQGQSEPTIEIISNARAGASRIRFQPAGQGQQRSGKLAMHIRARIKKGVSAVKLPLRSWRLLGRGHRGQRTQRRDRYRQQRKNTSRAALCIR